MLNISTTHAVSWPPPVSTQVAAVSAVDPVRPVQGGRRSGQSGAEAQPPEGGQRQKNGVKSSEDDRAPLLPRKSRSETSPSGRALMGARGRGDPVDKQEAENAVKKLEAEKVAAEARKQHLQTVLSDVWKASAAVVDLVLGRERGPSGVASAAGVEGASFPSQVAGTHPHKRPNAEPLPWPVMPRDSAASAADVAASEFVTSQDVVAYDERGNSSLAPLEAGVLIDRRV